MYSPISTLAANSVNPADLVFPERHEPAVPASGDDTAALVAALRRGEEPAVRDLYARYASRLSRYALVVCRGDEMAAADAVQNAFLKAVRSLRAAADEAALWAWLARACRTSAMDQHRGARRYLAFLTKFAEHHQAPPDDGESIWHRALAVAMEDLGADERALIDARYTDRIPLASLAAERQTTERAIEGRLARLRETLRQSILRQLAAHRHED